MSETRRSFRDHPLFQLTRVRFLEFVREPEALFWVFVFPVLLTAGLGLAFRTRAPEQVKVGVLEGPRAAPVIASLQADKRVMVKSLNDSGAAQALRTGKVAVLVIPGDGSVTYRFDDHAPVRRLWRVHERVARFDDRGRAIAFVGALMNARRLVLRTRDIENRTFDAVFPIGETRQAIVELLHTCGSSEVNPRIIGAQ